MHGCQVTEPHPCPGKHGLYFQKKKYGSITPKIKRKKVIFFDFGLDGGVPPGPRDPNPCLE